MSIHKAKHGTLLLRSQICLVPPLLLLFFCYYLSKFLILCPLFNCLLSKCLMEREVKMEEGRRRISLECREVLIPGRSSYLIITVSCYLFLYYHLIWQHISTVLSSFSYLKVSWHCVININYYDSCTIL